ncbi:MAG TPA: WhiB family transcriptional regulator [Ilumatobacter sp.]|nr:WhiB family transcriptional regulator [Ilumatobacter sp.]
MTSYLHTADYPTLTAVDDDLTLDDRFVATTFARVVDEFVDDVLTGIDLTDIESVSTDTTHSIARCSDGEGTLTHLFFSDDEFDIARAKAICSKCRLAPTCLEGALDRGEAYGVWGGELLIDGVIVAVKRGRGRPPKTPRPVLVVDEVPLPPHLVA